MSNCNQEKSCCGGGGVRWPYVIAVLGALLIVGALAWTIRHYTTPPSLVAERAALRTKNLAELRSAERQSMDTFGWMDQPKGIVRLTVDRAVELTVAAWQNPAAALTASTRRRNRCPSPPSTRLAATNASPSTSVGA